MEQKEYMIIKNKITQNDKNKNTQLHNFNFGFALLKNILAFDVIITHCFNKNTAQNNTILFITKRRKVHVPSFFILSFYYNYNTLVSSNIKKKIYRLNRLLIPYILWPLIIFVFSNLINAYRKFHCLSSFNILIFQLLTGQGQNLFHFWYLFDLIITTLLFMAIIILFRKKHLFIIIEYFIINIFFLLIYC